MSTQSDIERIEEALSACRERIVKYSSFEMLNSIEQQLLYLRSLLDGSENGKSKLSQIVLGIYAVREFHDTDRGFAELLVDANDLAGRLKY